MGAVDTLGLCLVWWTWWHDFPDQRKISLYYDKIWSKRCAYMLKLYKPPKSFRLFNLECLKTLTKCPMARLNSCLHCCIAATFSFLNFRFVSSFPCSSFIFRTLVWIVQLCFFSKMMPNFWHFSHYTNSQNSITWIILGILIFRQKYFQNLVYLFKQSNCFNPWIFL